MNYFVSYSLLFIHCVVFILLIYSTCFIHFIFCNKQGRAFAFVEWLVAHIPHSALAAGILDVAGGAGDVAFLLTSKYGFPVYTHPSMAMRQYIHFVIFIYILFMQVYRRPAATAG